METSFDIIISEILPSFGRARNLPIYRYLVRHNNTIQIISNYYIDCVHRLYSYSLHIKFKKSCCIVISSYSKQFRSIMKNIDTILIIHNKIRFEWVEIIYDMSKTRHLYRSVSLIPFYLIRQPALEVYCIRYELCLLMANTFPLLKLIMTSTG